MYKKLRKVLLLVLLAITVACGSLFVVACGKNDKPSGDEGNTKVTYSVTVTLASDVSDVTLTSLKAQWYSGSNAAGDAVALSAEGKASVELDAGNYTVELVGVPSTATYQKASVTAAAPSATINITKKAVTPSAQKLSAPTGVKIEGDMLSWNAVEHADGYQVYSDGYDIMSLEATDERAVNLAMRQLSVGTHKITVVALGDGENYLDSDPSAAVDYTVEGSVVEPEELAAPVVTLDGHILSWTVVENAVEYEIYDGDKFLETVDASDDAEDLKINLAMRQFSEGLHLITVVAKGDGVNYSDSTSEPVEYNVVYGDEKNIPEGGTDYWYEGPYDWAHHEGNPYAIAEVGTYYIPVKFTITTGTEYDWETGNEYEVTRSNVYAHVIEFTAPEDGEHSYTFSWDTYLYNLVYLNSFVDAIGEDDCLINDDGNGILIFSLNKGDKVIIVLRYINDDDENPLTEGDELGYELTIESGDPITQGSLYLPFEIDEFEGEHTLPEGYGDLTEAYFTLPENPRGNTYKITFAEGVSVSVRVFDFETLGYVFSELENEEEFVPEGYGIMRVTVTAGVKLSFTLTKVIVPGSADQPIALTKDVEASYTFQSYNSAWFTFTPDASGYYRIVAGSSVLVFESLIEGEGYDQVGNSIYVGGRNDLYLESGKTYYLELGSDWGNTVTIKVINTPNTAGEITNPKTLQVGENDADFTNTGYVYFKYTVTAKGKLSFSNNAESGFYMSFYSDAGYSEYLELDYDGENGVYYCEVEVGDVFYVIADGADANAKVIKVTLTLAVVLDAPANVKVSNEGVLSWNEVTNASGYSIFVDGVFLCTIDDALQCNLNRYQMSIGRHTVSVVALGDGVHYLTSEPAESENEYVFKGQLPAPTNVLLNGTNLSWDAVANATKYEIYKGEEKVGETEDEFYTIENGSGTYYVVAVGDGDIYLNSDKSAGIEFDATVTFEVTVIKGEGVEELPADLKVELYKFDPENTANNSRGDKVTEANVVNGSATLSADAGHYLVVLVGYDEDFYTSEQQPVGEVLLATITLDKVVLEDVSVEIEGYEAISTLENLYVVIHEAETDKLLAKAELKSASVTLQLPQNKSGTASIEGLSDGYYVYTDDINSVNKFVATLYVIEQPTLELDANDWIDATVLPYKTLYFKLGTTVQTDVQYYLLIDPESVGEQGPEFTINYGNGKNVTITPEGNYWAGIKFDELKLAINNSADTNIELRFKLVSTKPATIIEDGGSVTLQISNEVSGEITTGESIVAGDYILTATGFSMVFTGTVTLYLGAEDNTGYSFKAQRGMITPSSYKVHLEPGLVIRVTATGGETNVTVAVEKVPEGKEVTITGKDQQLNILLSDETPGTTINYTIKIAVEGINYSDGGYIMITAPGRGAPLPVGVKATLNCGGGVSQTADGSDYGQINLGLSDIPSDSVSWDLTLELAANANLSGVSLVITFVSFS